MASRNVPIACQFQPAVAAALLVDPHVLQGLELVWTRRLPALWDRDLTTI